MKFVCAQKTCSGRRFFSSFAPFRLKLNSRQESPGKLLPRLPNRHRISLRPGPGSGRKDRVAGQYWLYPVKKTAADLSAPGAAKLKILPGILAGEKCFLQLLKIGLTAAKLKPNLLVPAVQK